jgi:hypothetical protein
MPNAGAFRIENPHVLARKCFVPRGPHRRSSGKPCRLSSQGCAVRSGRSFPPRSLSRLLRRVPVLFTVGGNSTLAGCRSDHGRNRRLTIGRCANHPGLHALPTRVTQRALRAVWRRQHPSRPRHHTRCALLILLDAGRIRGGILGQPHQPSNRDHQPEPQRKRQRDRVQRSRLFLDRPSVVPNPTDAVPLRSHCSARGTRPTSGRFAGFGPRGWCVTDACPCRSSAP